MKIIKIIFVAFFISFLFGFLTPAIYAQTILPKPEASSCVVNQRGQPTNDDMKKAFGSDEGFKNIIQGADNPGSKIAEILGCAVKLGRIRLYMVPFFITYLIEMLLGLAGLISVLFMVVGGYKYAVGGLIEDKESGKKTILHALIGLVVALSAWIVVNFIQVALTS